MKQNKIITNIVKNVSIAVLLLVCMQLVFFLSNVAATAIPRVPLEANIEKSLDEAAFANIYDYEQSVLGSKVSYDNNRYIISFVEETQFDSLIETSLLVEIEDYDYFGHHSVYSYWRYWHGWQLLTNICLFLAPIFLLQIVVFCLTCAASLFFVFQLRRYIGWWPALLFAFLAFFMTNIFGNFVGDLLLSISVFTLVACAGFILWLGRLSGERKKFYIYYFLIFSGGLFNFLDFLTVPALVLTIVVFSSLLALDCPHMRAKRALKNLLAIVLLFMLGYGFTWISKWILVALFVDPDVIISTVTTEMGLWVESGAAQYEGWRGMIYNLSPRLFAVMASLLFVFYMSPSLGVPEGFFAYPAGMICLAVFIGVLIVYFVAKRKGAKEGEQKPSTNTVILYLTALLVPLYIAIMPNHTLFHIGIFGYKSWSVVFAVIGSLLSWKILYIRGERNNRLASQSKPEQ